MDHQNGAAGLQGNHPMRLAQTERSASTRGVEAVAKPAATCSNPTGEGIKHAARSARCKHKQADRTNPERTCTCQGLFPIESALIFSIPRASRAAQRCPVRRQASATFR